MAWRASVLVVCVLLLGAGCSTSAPSEGTPVSIRPTPTPPLAQPTLAPTPSVSRGAVVIEAAEQYFYPEQVTISPGTTVLWKDVQGTHDMVADDRSFASAVLFEGGTYSFTFMNRGRYRYVCTLHLGAGMWAEVNVE
jgi:plastocyanin